MNKRVEKFEGIRNEVTSVINRFPKEERLDVLFGDWSLKDIVAHLNNWMIHDINCLKALKEGKEPYWEPEVNEFNRIGIEARKAMGWEEVYKEFVDLGEELLKLYSTLSDNLWNKPIWKGKSETAERFLEEDISHWEGEHLGDLKGKLKKIIGFDVVH